MPKRISGSTTAAQPAKNVATELDELPAPSAKARWIARRKAQVVAAVERGLLPLEEACRRYSLSIEEFASWQRALHRHGVKGLRVVASKLGRTRERLGRKRTAGRLALGS